MDETSVRRGDLFAARALRVSYAPAAEFEPTNPAGRVICQTRKQQTALSSGDSSAIEAIDEKISALLSQRIGLVSELRWVRAKADDLRSEISSVSGRILEERRSLDDIARRLREFSQERREALAKIRQLRDEAERFGQKLGVLRARVPVDADNTEAKLREVEWKLQTQRLSRDEEKKLVAVVRELERKLVYWKSVYATEKELTEARHQMRTSKARLDEISELRLSLDPHFASSRERLENLHRARNQLYEEMAQLRGDRNELQSQLDQVDQTLATLRESRRRLLEERKRKESERELLVQTDLLEKAKAAALQKLAEGKKLSLDELKLAYDEDRAELLK